MDIRYNMAKTTLVLRDSVFRFVIPKNIRHAENLELGDTIEISVKKVKTEKAKAKAFREKFDEVLNERLSLLSAGELAKLKTAAEELAKLKTAAEERK